MSRRRLRVDRHLLRGLLLVPFVIRGPEWIVSAHEECIVDDKEDLQGF